MISGKNPVICQNRVVKRDAIFGVMQRCHGNFVCAGGVLSPALVLSFRIFSDDIPCLNIFLRSSFGEKEIVICLK